MDQYAQRIRTAVAAGCDTKLALHSGKFTKCEVVNQKFKAMRRG